MTNLITRIINIASIALIFGVVFVLGFYLGYRFSQINSPVVNESTLKDISSKGEIEAQIVTREVEAIQFIKANQDRKCDENHPVKGTFNPDNGNYYLKSNKSYDRIKPDICFATENYARDSAGFLKKF